MSSLIFNSCIYGMATGRINFESDQFAVVLLTSDYQPNKRDHLTRADVESFEVEGQGYREGGQVSDISIHMDEHDALVITLGASRWPKATISARYAAYYKRTGEASDEDLVALVDFSNDVASYNGTFATAESVLRLQT